MDEDGKVLEVAWKDEGRGPGLRGKELLENEERSLCSAGWMGDLGGLLLLFSSCRRACARSLRICLSCFPGFCCLRLFLLLRPGPWRLGFGRSSRGTYPEG